MTYAQGSRSRLSLVVESSFGTTPGTPSMLEIPFTSHTLDLQKARVQGDDIQSDRMPRVDRHGQRNGAGDINVALRATDYDELIECAFLNTFTTSGAATLKVGTTPQYLSIEDGAIDVTQFRQFTGMTVSQMAISMQLNQMVRATFSMVGQDMTLAQSTLGSPTSPSGNEPFDSFNGTMKEGGATIAIVTGLNFTLNNAFAPAFALGSQTAAQLEFGRAVVEGEVTMYFEDNTVIDKFINETETSLEFQMDDTTSGESYTWLFPNVRYNGAGVPVNDPQSRIVTLPFVSLYDSTEATNLKLTRAA